MHEGLKVQKAIANAQVRYPRFVTDDECMAEVLLEAIDHGLFLWADPKSGISVISREKPTQDFCKVHGVSRL